MSTTTNLDIKESYSYFTNSISEQSKVIDDLLNETRRKALYIATQLVHVGESHNLRIDIFNQVRQYLDGTFRFTREQLEEINIKNMYSEDWFISKTHIITAYFKILIATLINEYKLEEIKKVLTLCNIEYQLYYRIVNTFYTRVSISLLNGFEYNIYNVGILRVASKKANLSRGVKFKIDWGESFKLLKYYANKHYPSIYKDYIEGILNKRAFIHTLIPYTYNETTNPDGFKWLVHLHKEENAWLMFQKKRINPDYNIIPSNFIMNETRSQVDFTNNAKSERDILESGQLGFRDKLNCLLRFDPTYIETFVKL